MTALTVKMLLSPAQEVGFIYPYNNHIIMWQYLIKNIYLCKTFRITKSILSTAI